MKAGEIVGALLATGSGRVGAVLLVVLVAVSLFVLVRFPLDFGPRRWNNPEAWADNPKAVPPVWTLLWSRDAVKHTVFEATSSGDGAANAGTYTFAYQHRGGGPPTFLSFAVSDVRFNARPQVITLRVERPDGKSILLTQVVVRGPRAGESPPYLRYQESPSRVNLSGDVEAALRVSTFLAQEFRVTASPSALQGDLAAAVFGVPLPGPPLAFQPLPGRYLFTVQVQAASPEDSVGSLRLALGGSAYGVMGTDALGRDLAMGLLFGFPVALAIGIATSLFATAIGTALGLMSGFLGGKTDLAIQRFSDIWSNVPLLPILVFLIFILGPRLWLVVVIMILFGWPGLTIVVRSMVLQIRSGQLVEATRALGASRRRIMFRHLLFQIAPFIFAQMIFFTPGAILAEAGLSFLGLGDPSIPTWGQILESGFRTGAVYVGYWWWVLPPGLLIVATAMAFVLLTLGLEPVVNPRLRSR
ncbi:MAG: ABC transporter permease [Chloroflexi bacterium]|nr:ABC transporter permease [Chloroflexota bacterium]